MLTSLPSYSSLTVLHSAPPWTMLCVVAAWLACCGMSFAAIPSWLSSSLGAERGCVLYVHEFFGIYLSVSQWCGSTPSGQGRADMSSHLHLIQSWADTVTLHSALATPPSGPPGQDQDNMPFPETCTTMAKRTHSHHQQRIVLTTRPAQLLSDGRQQPQCAPGKARRSLFPLHQGAWPCSGMH